ncbi:hypothetical protein STANM309S_00275 [Streptomyces tanashiensis]
MAVTIVGAVAMPARRRPPARASREPVEAASSGIAIRTAMAARQVRSRAVRERPSW